MTSSEWLPPPVPFEIVRRGYSPDQVTAHIEKLEYDLRIATANREATSQRLAELAAQLSTTQAEADALRAQLDRQALEPMSMSGLSDRMQRMIRIAEEEAAETRSTAAAYAAELRERADHETADLRAKAEDEAAAMRSALQAQLTELAEARAAFDAERDRTRAQLAEQITDLIAEATAEAEATRAQAREESAQLTAAAAAEAERVVREAQELAQRLDAEAAARRAEQEEDFSLAINARRSEAHRAITEAEQLSRADAAARIDRATEHAQRLVASATEHAEAVVSRAAAESQQRVADADAAVRSLTELRAELHAQLARLAEHLDQVRAMVDGAAPVLAPPDSEAGRPTPDQFPNDPAGRPTVPAGFDAEPPVWQPPPPPADPADERAARSNGGSEGTVSAEAAAPDRSVSGGAGDAEETTIDSAGANEPGEESTVTDEDVTVRMPAR
jgi:cell division septum initiation protein DivIVA